jgi:hypothetical protein
LEVLLFLLEEALTQELAEETILQEEAPEEEVQVQVQEPLGVETQAQGVLVEEVPDQEEILPEAAAQVQEEEGLEILPPDRAEVSLKEEYRIKEALIQILNQEQ